VETVIKLDKLISIPDGEAKGFDPLQQGRDSLFVVRQGSDFYPWANACPHVGYEGAPMAWRKDAYLNVERTRIICSGHAAEFDVESGVCLDGPCLGTVLQKADVRLAEDGCLYLFTNKD
jgi:nitrite reductase/ring-hydroxylating ferredoxin subunit